MPDIEVYTERQRFTQWWVWLILGPLVVLAIYALVQQLIFGEPFGENPMPDGVLVGFSALVFGMVVLLWVMRLDTRIDAAHIEIRFFPFFKKQVAWADVERAEMIRYGFVGYGVRMGTRYGTVYNTAGNRGLALQLTTGRKLVIGTRQPEPLQSFLDRLGVAAFQGR